jgi:gluconolactonase
VSGLHDIGVLATGLDHPECVAWDAVGGRLIAGGEAGQVYAIGLDGSVAEVGTTGGFLYGVTVASDGDVVVCDFGNACVSRVGPSGDVEPVSSGTADRPIVVPNFAAYDRDGSLYVTDSGQWGADDGAIYRVDPDGVTSVWSDATPAFPNGCCLSLEGDALLVVESRARRVVRLSFAGGAPESVADLTGSQPDGIALAADGTMLVGCYRPDRIWIVPPGGDPEILVDDPDGVVLNQPANVAFYGAALDRVAISSLGGWSIGTMDLGLTGHPVSATAGRTEGLGTGSSF